MSTVTLRNTNPLGAIFLPLIGRELAADEEFDIDAALAGRPPKPGVDGDIGEGLLSQVGNYELVTKKKG
jgi:hypothetical protein